MLKAFTITHHGHEGVGSGSTVVVATSERMALHMIKVHFDTKPEGYRQYHRIDMLEIEPHEDSHLGNEAVDTTTAGVKLEYRFSEDGPPCGEIVYFGFPVEEIAAELDSLQAKKYDGRGVSCVRTLIFFLRREEFDSAQAVARNESDKIRSHEDIVAVLKRIGFWYELDFSSWSEA